MASQALALFVIAVFGLLSTSALGDQSSGPSEKKRVSAHEIWKGRPQYQLKSPHQVMQRIRDFDQLKTGPSDEVKIYAHEKWMDRPEHRNVKDVQEHIRKMNQLEAGVMTTAGGELTTEDTSTSENDDLTAAVETTSISTEVSTSSAEETPTSTPTAMSTWVLEDTVETETTDNRDLEVIKYELEQQNEKIKVIIIINLLLSLLVVLMTATMVLLLVKRRKASQEEQLDV